MNPVNPTNTASPVPAYRYSASRLAALYVALCVLFVGGSLWLGFLITARAGSARSTL